MCSRFESDEDTVEEQSPLSKDATDKEMVPAIFMPRCNLVNSDADLEPVKSLVFDLCGSPRCAKAELEDAPVSSGQPQPVIRH